MGMRWEEYWELSLRGAKVAAVTRSCYGYKLDTCSKFILKTAPLSPGVQARETKSARWDASHIIPSCAPGSRNGCALTTLFL